MTLNLVLVFLLGVISGPILLLVVIYVSDAVYDTRERRKCQEAHDKWKASTCALCGHTAERHISRMVDWDPFNTYPLCIRVAEVDGYQHFKSISEKEDEDKAA